MGLSGFSPVIVACAALLVAGCDESLTIDRQLAEAHQYHRKGDLKAAAVVLKNVLQRDPRQGEARYLTGLILKQDGQPEAAEYHFRAALNAKFDPKLVLPLLAQSLFEQGEFNKVLEATRSSDHGEIALQPEVLNLRGHSQISLGSLDEAAQSFAQALERRPEYAPALLGQVRLALIKRDSAAASVLLNRALAANPSSLDAWLMRGDLDRASGKLDAALAAYEKALSINPAGVAANLNLASTHLESGKLNLARKNIEALLKSAPDSAVGHYLLGLLEFRSANLAAAREAVDRVLKTLPSHLPATALSGVLAYSAGDYGQAVTRLGEAVDRAPNSLYLRRIYAAALLKSGQPRSALKVLERALKSAPKDPIVLALFAEAKLENGEVAAARKYFELAAAQRPKDPRIRSGLGLSRLAAGETEKALADLEAAGGLGAHAADIFLANHFVSRGRYDKALEAVARLEATRPNDPATLNLKGATLFAKGDMAGARRAFERAAKMRSGEFTAAVNLAQIDMREKNPAAARGHFEKILKRDPDNVKAMLAISDLAAVAGNLDEALLWAERATRVEPRGFGPLLALAKLHLIKGDIAKTLSLAKGALAAQPGHTEALNILGYAQLRAGETIAALDTYTLLASRYPNSPEAHYGLSGAQSANGRVAAAERSLRKALALRADFPEAMYALSALQLRAGKTAETGKLIGDAQKRLPNSALPAVIAGDAAMAEKRYEQAAKAYEAAFAREKSQAVVLKLHRALREAGKVSAAEALAADWLKSNPDDIPVRYLVADAAIRADNFRVAAEQYEYALRKESDKLPVLHNLVWVYEKMNDPRALEAAETAYNIAPERPGVLFNLARLLVKKGDTDRGIKLLERARSLSPDSQLVRYDLAKAYVKVGANGNARLELEQLLRGRQDFEGRAGAEDLLRRLRN